MPKEQKSQLFTLSQQYIADIIHQCDEQTVIVDDLLKDMVEEKINFCNKKAIMPYIAEIIWVNHSILKNVNSELNTPAYHFNEDTQEEELIFTERSILELQNYMLVRWYAIEELNRLSCSISLH